MQKGKKSFPMSVFSPTAWLSRTRLASSNTADFSKDGSLEGLKYIQSQSSSQTQGPTPIPNYNQNYPPSSSAKMPCSSHDRFHDDRCYAGNHRNRSDSGSDSSGDFFNRTMDQEDYSRQNRDRNDYTKGNWQNYKGPLQPDNDDDPEGRMNQPQELLQDSFQADVYLGSLKVEDLHDKAQGENSQPGREKASSPTGDGVFLRNVGSFGNGSCISSLSADETHCEHDDKTTKSMEGGNKVQDLVALKKQGGRVRAYGRSSSKGSNTTKGRDFGGAFDHLDHLIDPKDLLDENVGDNDEGLPDPVVTSLVEDSFHQPCERYQLQQPRQQQHQRSQTFVSTTKLLKERPKPLQQRAASDFFALEQSRPSSLLQRSTSIGSRTAVSNSNYSLDHHHHHRRRSSQPVAAHATLRECLCKSKANTIGESTGHKRLFTSAQMPHILSVRSTSLTVQSSTANTVASSSGGVSGGIGNVPSRNSGVVWNGQPIYNLTVPPPSPSSTRGSHSRNSSYAMGSIGGGLSSAGQGLDGCMDANSSKLGHVSRHSAGSGTSFLSQDAYSGGHRSLASSANVCSTSSDCRSTIAGNALEHSHHHQRTISDDAETTLIKELQMASLMDDKTAISSSIESASFHSPSTRRRKPSLKDEMKFILKKMVPTPLKKVTVRKSKVNLERSSGCLT